MNRDPVTFAADVRSHALGSIEKRWKYSYRRCHTALLDEAAANWNAPVGFPARFVHEHVSPELEEVCGNENHSLWNLAAVLNQRTLRHRKAHRVTPVRGHAHMYGAGKAAVILNGEPFAPPPLRLRTTLQ